MNKIEKIKLYTNSAISETLTWIIVLILTIQAIAFVIWFQPSLAMTLANVTLSMLVLGFWLFILIRSVSYSHNISLNYLQFQQNEFNHYLTDCHPDFETSAKESWVIVTHIMHEFDSRQIQHDIEASLSKIVKLTIKHGQFYARTRCFGDNQQKSVMEDKINQQINNIELARQGLLRLGGHLTILDYGKDEAQKIEQNLKVVNQGLENAIGEIDHVENS